MPHFKGLIAWVWFPLEMNAQRDGGFQVIPAGAYLFTGEWTGLRLSGFRHNSGRTIWEKMSSWPAGILGIYLSKHFFMFMLLHRRHSALVVSVISA